MGTSLVTTTTLAVTILFLLLATVAVALRLYTQRVYSRMVLGADDYFIVLALAWGYGILVLTIIAGAVGGVNETKNNGSAVWFVKMLYIEPFFINPTLALTKISIVLFYKKIFVTKSFHIACWTMIAIVTLWCLATILVQLTWVSPISNAWNLKGTYYRLNYGASILAFAGINTGLDVITFLLPLPAIGQLQMKTRQKIMVGGVFSLGMFCIIAGACRIYYGTLEIQGAVHSSSNSRYAINTLYIWDRIEPLTATICACLPTYGPIVRSSHIPNMIRSITSKVSPNSTDRSHSLQHNKDQARVSRSKMSWKGLQKGSHSVVIDAYNTELQPQTRYPYPDAYVHITSQWEVERESSHHSLSDREALRP